MTAASAVALLALPAGAGGATILTLDKVVGGDVPAGTQFVVTVECGGAIIRDNGSHVASTQRTFDAEGNPVGSDTVEFDAFEAMEPGDEVCTVTETETGGATDVTYACEDTGIAISPMCESTGPQSEPVELVILDPLQSATVTITNDFVAPPPPTPPPAPAPTPTAAPAPPVVAPPALTG